MKAKLSRASATEHIALLLQGMATILFGIAAVFWPGLTSEVLVYLFAAFLLADGVIALAWGLMRLSHLARAALILLLGLAELGIGLYLVRNPIIAFATFMLILGLALIVRGVFAFAHAFTSNGLPAIKMMDAILGVLGVVIGVFVLAQPVVGGLTFVWILGLYALVSGPVLIAMSGHVAKPGKNDL
ncbi:MAG TPA: DUF308 domain-containing protein [Candidatus Saccharimonadales bacterium]|nr:DUF308 domain-containing protein [Candidatus Saccharimonadales bacterium]